MHVDSVKEGLMVSVQEYQEVEDYRGDIQRVIVRVRFDSYDNDNHAIAQPCTPEKGMMRLGSGDCMVPEALLQSLHMGAHSRLK